MIELLSAQTGKQYIRHMVGLKACGIFGSHWRIGGGGGGGGQENSPDTDDIHIFVLFLCELIAYFY